MAESIAQPSGESRDHLKWFIEDCRDRGLHSRTIEGYRSVVRKYLAFLSGRGTDPIRAGREDVRAYLHHLRERGVAPKTVSGHFAALSSFYNYLVYEEHVAANPVLPVRLRYLRAYKGDYRPPERKVLTVEQLSAMVRPILDPRDKAIIVLLAKTGLRRNELIRVDIEDLDLKECSVTLKPAPKRSNRVVFFDEETKSVLLDWLDARKRIPSSDPWALFVTSSGTRIDRTSVWDLVRTHAARAGLCDPDSPRREEHFGPHWLRHFWTTWLLRNGMSREFVKELRGDARREAIDLYHHIDREELRKAYLAAVPKLGVT